MKPLLGIKAMMLGVFCAPFLVICIYFLIRPQPLEIPPELTHVDSGTQLLDAGLLDLAIAEYDLATEINPDNLVAYQKRGDAYFAKGDLGHIADQKFLSSLPGPFSVFRRARGQRGAKKGARQEGPCPNLQVFKMHLSV